MIKSSLGAVAVLIVLSLAVGSVLWGAAPETPESKVYQIEITISPNVLVLGNTAVWVTVHTNIPYRDVDLETVDLELDGIPVVLIKYDARGYLVGKFNSRQVKDIVTPPQATLTLTGVDNDGSPFFGVDTIVIKPLIEPR